MITKMSTISPRIFVNRELLKFEGIEVSKCTRPFNEIGLFELLQIYDLQWNKDK